MTTAAEIQLEIIDWWNKEHPEDEDSPTEYLDSVLDDFEYRLDSGIRAINLDSGVARQVEQKGGEGEGEEYYLIFSVDEQFFRVEGYYTSWTGANWEGAEVEEVEAVEVLVTKYHTKGA